MRANTLKLGCVFIVLASVPVYWNNFEAKQVALKYGMNPYGFKVNQTNFVGFYGPEKWEQGIFRWSGRQGVIHLGESLDTRLTFFLAHPDIKKRPVTATVFMEGKQFDKFKVARIGFTERCYALKGGPDHPVDMRVEVSRTWEPYNYGYGNDKRNLGIAVGLIDQKADCSM